MTQFKSAIALIGVASILAPAAASAQAKPAAAAPAPAAAAGAATATGPALPGICVFSNERAIATSTVGKYVISRMEQITTQANAELNGEKTAIETDGKALEASRATTAQETYEQRALALQQRANNLQRKAQLRSREIDATEQKALARIGSEMDPILKTVYQQRGCAILFDRIALFGVNGSMDVTDAVVAQLNTKITQFPFDRERLDQQPAAGAAPAAAKPRG